MGIPTSQTRPRGTKTPTAALPPHKTQRADVLAWLADADRRFEELKALLGDTNPSLAPDLMGVVRAYVVAWMQFEVLLRHGERAATDAWDTMVMSPADQADTLYDWLRRIPADYTSMMDLRGKRRGAAD
jgi:hypothetical protein